MLRHLSALLAPLFAAGSLLAAAPAKIPVLIVDGQNNHQWAITTPMLKRILEQTGRFTVDVSTSPAAKPAAPAKKANLDRPRKTVADIHGIPSSLDMDRSASAARSGRAEMRDRLAKNTSASPALTSGDVDADWQSADSVGDEAPGGDNPTPDQDVVDDIGRALGVEYDDDEELQGGAEIEERDRHRWELDPSSKDDLEDEE